MAEPPRLRSRHVRKAAALWAAALLAAAGLALAPPQVPPARADACADVEVSFARGTDEPPGPGFVGENFADALTDLLPGRTVKVYAVDYPATLDAPSAGAGGNDLSHHIQNTIKTCPNTKIVLGGYSQGAAVVDLVVAKRPLPFTSVTVPFLGDISLEDSGFDSVPPAAVYQRISAVALFGNPSHYVYPHPLPMPDGLAARTTDVCADGDPVCTPPDTEPTNFASHLLYAQNGLTDQAAAFVADKLGPVGKPGPQTPPKPPQSPAPPPAATPPSSPPALADEDSVQPSDDSTDDDSTDDDSPDGE